MAAFDSLLLGEPPWGTFIAAESHSSQCQPTGVRHKISTLVQIKVLGHSPGYRPYTAQALPVEHLHISHARALPQPYPASVVSQGHGQGNARR